MHVPRAYMPVMLAKGPAPFTARSVALGTQNGTRVVPLRQSAQDRMPRAGMLRFQILLLFLSMCLRAVVHAFGSLPSGHHLDVKERVKQASAVDPLWSWNERNTGTKR